MYSVILVEFPRADSHLLRIFTDPGHNILNASKFTSKPHALACLGDHPIHLPFEVTTQPAQCFTKEEELP